MKNIKKCYFDLYDFFGITDKEINDLISKLEIGKELNFLDYLLIDKIKLLSVIIERSKNEKY